MKTAITLGFVLAFPFAVRSQTFQKKTSWRDSSFLQVDAQWIDMDNDSLLDIIVAGEGRNSTWQIKPYKNSFNAVFQSQPPTIYSGSVSDYKYTDINKDNYLDVQTAVKLADGRSILKSFINQNDFSFAGSGSSSPAASPENIFFSDLDNDGKADLIMTDSQSLKIYKVTSVGYELKSDSLGLRISAISLSDLNNDAQQDIIVSGNDKNNKPFLFVLFNKGDFKFTKTTINSPLAGIIETGDIDHDGQFDIIVGGSNASGNQRINFYTNTKGKFEATDSILGYHTEQLLSADFNSDGLTDLYLMGKLDNGKRFNLIRNYDKTMMSFDTTRLSSQSFGDYDHDGDLDLLRVLDSAAYFVFEVYENTTNQINKNPQPSPFAFAISTPYHTFIYWDAAMDDHTPQPALTYDLSLDTSDGSIIVLSEFETPHKRRKRPSHGNQTTNHFAIVNDLIDQHYNFAVQPVDNSFHAGSSGGGSGIGGSIAGEVERCPDLKHEYLQTCKEESVTLTSLEPAYWFSAKLGFLELSTTYNFIAQVTDSLYSFVPQHTDCSKNKIWIIHVNDQSLSEKETKYVCEDVPFTLGIIAGWQRVTWAVGTETFLGDSITLKINQPQIVTVTASSGNTCSYQKEFQLRISKPIVTVNGDAFTITKGQSTNLVASGARAYRWQPAENLNSAIIPNPIASPRVTTQYQVTGTDSVGCQATEKVIVYVEELGFIPTLFTPNNDGKNDELKIYGVTEASNFKFIIVNREGSVVYETKDIHQIATMGWDGTHHGAEQKSGLYYWKIEGNLSTGGRLTLNGKSTGSVLLLK